MSKDIEVTTHHFKTHLSALIRDMQAGRYDRIIVKKNKHPIGVFTRPSLPARRSLAGFMKDEIKFTEKEWRRWMNIDKEVEKDFEDSIDADSP
jgi:hypothetical protein